MNALGLDDARLARVVLGLTLLIVVMVAGTAGYVAIEGWSLLDSAYMSVITVTTVGYSEVEPLSDEGKIFSIVLMLVGVGTAFYILTALVALIIEGDLRQVFGAKRMKLMIEHLHDHHIVCGFGRVGEQIARELQEQGVAFVIVDEKEGRVEDAREAGMLAVAGDATSEETLREAGIERCSAIIAASDSDSTNTYITLTAKGLRNDVYVVSRVSSGAVESKLRQAGADRTVSPYRIGGRRIAFAALQPLMVDFIDMVTGSGRDDRILAEIAVEEGGGIAGRPINEALQDHDSLVVLAVRASNGRLDVGPPPERTLAAGESLLLVANEEALRRLGLHGRTPHAGSRPEKPPSGLGRLFRRH